VASRIEDYALIGDCETAALVGRDGSIDWLCWPRFDSSACFAALLGTDENGRWKISPASDIKRVSRQYQKGTLILDTEFETAEGVVVITDFMPLREPHSNLIRLVRCIRGAVAMRMELTLRFDYGETIPWVTREDGDVLRAIAGPNMAFLHTTAQHRGNDHKTISEFAIREGETIPFVLTYCPSHLPQPEAVAPEAELAKTQKYWSEWTSKSTYRGVWADAVERSLITLKALTYWHTGGILAAPTTSLPEKIAGPRNWDYRFCWLRDASFTLGVLMRAGYFEEAAAWQDWLLRAVAGSPEQAQVLYGIAGERRLPELELPWLSGYEGSKPVRIGNAASEQLQIDVYGEISAAMYNARKGKLPQNEPSAELECALLDHLEKIWREPDEGIWEVRSARLPFTHSKVMAWVAFDRAIKSSEEFGMHGSVDQWRAVRDQIHEDVCRNGFDSAMNSFVQSYGSKNLDANLLMIVKSRFLPASDPRIVGTIQAIEGKLIRDGFVLRYDTEETEDGLPPGEGIFIPCSFWLADAYTLMGRAADAKAMVEKLLAIRNDVGLLSEEYDVAGKRLVGNFPQAFSHVALLNAIFNINRAENSPKTSG
jgi:GH15 family glucan-1,4-alpha-glucosidase